MWRGFDVICHCMTSLESLSQRKRMCHLPITQSKIQNCFLTWHVLPHLSATCKVLHAILSQEMFDALDCSSLTSKWGIWHFINHLAQRHLSPVQEIQLDATQFTISGSQISVQVTVLYSSTKIHILVLLQYCQWHFTKTIIIKNMHFHLQRTTFSVKMLHLSNPSQCRQSS